jgi:hypothetical protein
MKPQTWTLTVLTPLTLPFALGLAAFAQDQSALPGGVDPSSLGSSLILWSEMQRPEPVPQPLQTLAPSRSARGRAAGSSAAVTNGEHTTQPRQPSDVRTIVGTIVKEADKYVLKASDNATYQLDNQYFIRTTDQRASFPPALTPAAGRFAMRDAAEYTGRRASGSSRNLGLSIFSAALLPAFMVILLVARFMWFPFGCAGGARIC